MVIAYHIIMGLYGFWLPNDPRGSGSDYVGSKDLYEFGPATKVTGEQSVAKSEHDAELRREAKKSLKYKPVRLTGRQAKAIAEAFGALAATKGWKIYACAIMPDHIHLVIGSAKDSVERMMNLLKGAATRRLLQLAIHPFQHELDQQARTPKMFSRGGRHRFLRDAQTVRGRIKYVNDNPEEIGLPRQHWSFVIPFEH